MGKSNRKKQEFNYSEHYVILAELGEGGNAKVYRAKCKNSGELVALKALQNFDSEKKARFQDEIDIMATKANGINGVLPILNSNKDSYWYAMPIAESIMSHLESLPDSNRVNEVCRFSIELALILASLHEKQIYHRDIKPDNLYFYNGHAYIGDFGLVDFPDKEDNFTRDDKGLGAIFTIAPEMKRNPKWANGEKADVYSFAKTLWMLLSKDQKGFDGQYDCSDKTHNLHHYEHLKNKYLVEVERLLKQATDNEPMKRPGMKRIKEILESWESSLQDKVLQQRNEWNFIMETIFVGMVPLSSVFTNLMQIVDVLNVVGNSPAYNHLLFSEGGGLDFEFAQCANEEGCIYLVANSFWSVLKPKALYLETFEDSRWNYFFLETEEMDSIIGKNEYGYEHLVEDVPGHYVNSVDSVYGVYDYDSGRKFPDGFKILDRYYEGKFLIVPKMGLYNQMPKTYDGRHGVMSNSELREYVLLLEKVIIALSEKGYSESEILKDDIFNINPYSERMKSNSCLDLSNKNQDLPDVENYIKSNFQTWNFLEDLNNIEQTGKTGRLAFYMEFMGIEKCCGLLSTIFWYLSKDGTIKKACKGDISDCFVLKDRNDAIMLQKILNEHIKSLCNGYNVEHLSLKFGFSIKWHRIGMPTHLFTKQEIETEMRKADDRIGNRLVIDEDGYAHVICSSVDKELYPVSHEDWGARKNYVGKYSSLGDLNSAYNDSLACWLDYLKTGQSQYCDENCFCDEAKTIAKIKKIIKVDSNTRD